jgi:hypothetical protein
MRGTAKVSSDKLPGWGHCYSMVVRLENSNYRAERVAKRKKTQPSTTTGESIHWKVIFEATNSASSARRKGLRKYHP